MSALRQRLPKWRPINQDLIWGADDLDGLGEQYIAIDAAETGSRNLLRALARYHAKRAPNLEALEHWIGLAK